ncbi:MAG: HPr kinase/phosphorylase [Beijerinckiaceae bacterium]
MADNIHASCVVIGEKGVLLRGASGAGKSALALALIAHYQPTHFARLVADDRVLVENHHGQLVAVPHPVIAGRIEQRGVGILTAAFEQACTIALVVDLASKNGARLPDGGSFTTSINGVLLPLLTITDGGDALARITQHKALTSR